jgi:two-component system phosphate regulon sensor histidine kinase PhoR
MRRSPIPAVGVAGVAGVLALGWMAGAPPVATAVIAGLIAVFTALTWRRDRRLRPGQGGASPLAGPAAPSYAALVDALPDPVLVISGKDREDAIERRVVFANAAAGELLRVARSDARLVTTVRDPKVLQAVDEALFDDAAAEAVYERGGAQERLLRAQARPLGVAADGSRLALVVFRDETDLRRVERTRADFLANASHELRTPLASLSGFIETLRGPAKGDEAARERFLGIMQGQAARMSRLIDDLMSLSRIEFNEHIAPSGDVDLVQAARDVADAAGPLTRERGMTLEMVLPASDAVRVTGDRDQIVQVIQNLVDNALNYSAPGGTVTLTLAAGLSAEAAAAGGRAGAARLSLLTPDHAQDLYAAVRIADAGEGIAREHLPRLTERFYRVEGQKSGGRSGTGLGLAIVKHIMNRHRGGLAVESQPGEGTTFTAYWPLRREV